MLYYGLKNFNIYVLYLRHQQQEIVYKKKKENRNCYSKTTSILTVKYFGKKGMKRNTYRQNIGFQSLNILQILKLFQSITPNPRGKILRQIFKTLDSSKLLEAIVQRCS